MTLLKPKSRRGRLERKVKELYHSERYSSGTYESLRRSVQLNGAISSRHTGAAQLSAASSFCPSRLQKRPQLYPGRLLLCFQRSQAEEQSRRALSPDPKPSRAKPASAAHPGGRAPSQRRARSCGAASCGNSPPNGRRARTGEGGSLP